MPKVNTTKYLLRFDDLCPTMDWEIWSEIEELLLRRQVKPILAVVPDNRDPVLQVAPPVADFWDRVRTWQTRGWTIALHGFQHLYVSPHAGIVGVRKKSEFAGLPREQQEEKIRQGIEIFEREGIKTRVWIAPGHSFDAVTVSLLPQYGIDVISDGAFRHPYVSREKITWVPMQLYSFRPAPPGVWTVCCHHNSWHLVQRRRFRAALERHEDELWSLDDALACYGNRHSSWSARLCTSPRLSQLIIRCQMKLWSLRRRGNESKTCCGCEGKTGV